MDGILPLCSDSSCLPPSREHPMGWVVIEPADITALDFVCDYISQVLEVFEQVLIFMAERSLVDRLALIKLQVMC